MKNASSSNTPEENESRLEQTMIQTTDELSAQCYQFSLSLLSFIENHSQKGSEKTVAKNVLKRGLSIGEAVAEASVADTRREYKKLLEKALQRAKKTNYWLHLFKDCKREHETAGCQEILQELVQLTDSLAAHVTALKKKLSL